MIPAALPRTVAIALLRLALRIAPHDTLDWGRAMLNELNHVEGNWSALIWSLGGAGVLAKHAMLALILPGPHRRTVSTASELFDKEGPMRKPTLAVIASCVVASLLFFAAPVFRQAFQVSLAQWHDVLHVRSQVSLGGPDTDPELDALARKAEQNRDAEALAFVASRHPKETERVRWADEAIRLDPNLTWVYAINGAVELSSSGTERLSTLKQWDPQNALPHLLAAQKIGVTVTHGKEFPLGKVEESPSWEKEMDAAFQSPKLDTYLDRQKQLDQRVVSRYRLDPFQAASDGNWYGFPSYGVWYCSLYAQSLLQSGQALESRGDRKAAFEKYSAVARFGQMMSIDDELTFFMSKLLKEAYSRLGALSQAEGNNAAAAFYASLADHVDKTAARERALLRGRFSGSEISHWNAFLVRLSGLSILFCAALLLLCVLGVLVRNRSLKLASLHPSSLTVALGFFAAIGALLSSAVLFVSYRPYADLLQLFLRTGDDTHLPELSAFLRDAQLPIGSQFHLGPGSWYVASWNIVFSFWFGVSVLGALALVIALLRHSQTRPRPQAAA